MDHRHVTTEWSTPGYFGRATCVCCGFDMLGDNRVLTIRHKAGHKSAKLCDGCVNAIAREADGKLAYTDGSFRDDPILEQRGDSA